jgi:phage host-nuclease inhibitor protein Gam
MELNKEYFDERMTALRQDIGDVKREVKADIGDLRTEMNTKFDAILETLDVRERVEKTERQVEEIRRVLKLA